MSVPVVWIAFFLVTIFVFVLIFQSFSKYKDVISIYSTAMDRRNEILRKEGMTSPETKKLVTLQVSGTNSNQEIREVASSDGLSKNIVSSDGLSKKSHAILSLKNRIKVWTFWDSKKKPPLVEKCLETWPIHCPAALFEIHVLDAESAKTLLLSQFEKGERHPSMSLDYLFRKNEIPVTLFSDFLRLDLLAHFENSIWMDASTFLTSPFFNCNLMDDGDWGLIQNHNPLHQTFLFFQRALDKDFSFFNAICSTPEDVCTPENSFMMSLNGCKWEVEKEEKNIIQNREEKENKEESFSDRSSSVRKRVQFSDKLQVQTFIPQDYEKSKSDYEKSKKEETFSRTRFSKSRKSGGAAAAGGSQIARMIFMELQKAVFGSSESHSTTLDKGLKPLRMREIALNYRKTVTSSQKREVESVHSFASSVPDKEEKPYELANIFMRDDGKLEYLFSYACISVVLQKCQRHHPELFARSLSLGRAVEKYGCYHWYYRDWADQAGVGNKILHGVTKEGSTLNRFLTVQAAASPIIKIHNVQRREIEAELQNQKNALVQKTKKIQYE